MARQSSKDSTKPSSRWNANRVVKASVGADLRSGSSNPNPGQPTVRKNPRRAARGGGDQGERDRFRRQRPQPRWAGADESWNTPSLFRRPAYLSWTSGRCEPKRFHFPRLRVAGITRNASGVWAPGLHGWFRTQTDQSQFANQRDEYDRVLNHSSSCIQSHVFRSGRAMLQREGIV